MSIESPVVSIVLAVYNGEKYIKQTLNSIIGQTYKDWECIVVNDCSTDSTGEILNQYAAQDSRLRVFVNPVNLRLAKSLNFGVSQAKGKYIARMDADDICLPERLEKQVEFMEKNPDLAMSYTKFFTLQDGICRIGGCGRNNTPEDITAMLLFFNPVLHPSVMCRRDVMLKYPYDPARTCSEDMDLWTRLIADKLQIGCVDDYLFLYRLHSGQVTANSKKRQCDEVSDILKILYHRVLFDLSDEDIENIISSVYFRDKYNFSYLRDFYDRIIKADKKNIDISKKNINRAVFELLSEIHHKFSMSFSDKLGMLHFGGLSIISEYIERKNIVKKDVVKAEEAALKAGFVREESAEALPVFRVNEDYR